MVLDLMQKSVSRVCFVLPCFQGKRVVLEQIWFLWPSTSELQEIPIIWFDWYGIPVPVGGEITACDHSYRIQFIGDTDKLPMRVPVLNNNANPL